MHALDVISGLSGHPRGEVGRRSRTDAVDRWLQEASAEAVKLGASVVAVGGYGRRELAPGSDLDILLLVPAGAESAEIAAAADALWYPIWDAGIRLDHSVRTVTQAREAARLDVRVTLGLLDARTVWGDDALRAHLAGEVWADWRRDSARRIEQLRDFDEPRHRRHGELAHLIEPDLKESAGGLRDVTVVRALVATSLGDTQWQVLRDATRHLLDVREALHHVTGRATDLLARQDQAAVAERLALGSADDLLRSVFASGRTIAHSYALTWRQVEQQSKRRTPVTSWGSSRSRSRRPLAQGLVMQDGEVVFARGADPGSDPTLLLRAAAAAAQVGAALSPQTAVALGVESAALPSPWPVPAREDLVALLGAGRGTVPVWESLDQQNVWSRLIPGWDAVRNLPQHNPVHVWSVDRHLIETAVAASALVRTVDRPDLLLVAALLHDIAKGQPGDHCERGATVVAGLARHLGFEEADVHILEELVRHHLLLPTIATRRDPDDPATIADVMRHIPDESFLRLLHALTVADARAAGPVAASTWRLGLIADLVDRVQQQLVGQPPLPVPDLAALMAPGEEVSVVMDEASMPPSLIVTAPDFPGLLATVAGVFSLHRLNVRSARLQSVGDRGVSAWVVEPLFGDIPDLAQLSQDLRLALDDRIDIAGALALRERGALSGAEPVVRLVPGAAQRASVLEVRAHDSPALLFRVATALTASGCDVVAARVATMGAEVVDVFYLVDRAARAPLAQHAADAVVGAVARALALT